ncbi:UDP-N-acetylglucosamine--dolichyl-phosphate N-acetylglucosaminyltransferase [Candidatus Anstonella stagnisolia]|nr:UDP-N-acetylglucosamine--dolichyl-phosphate N-acetylglucosaminyltransferase [Candidatus Anstonella stagnisolia]
MYSVILPVLNEAGSIRAIVRALLEDEECFAIVADDGSTDGTREEIEKLHSKRVLFLDRSKEEEHGLCISVLHALKFAKGEFVVVMDADGQHPVAKARELVEALKNGSDFAIGAREDWETMKLHRKVISLGATAIANASLFLRGKKTVKDPMSGFFGARAALAQVVAQKGKFVGKGYKVLFEMLKYAPRDAQISEVQFCMGKREDGKSKIRWRHIFYFLQAALF